jgi:hypothetical protein
MYICPVCGYYRLTSPPMNFAICPCCYTEFGYDDTTLSHAQLRQEWIRKGMPWEGVNVEPPPHGWNPYAQLERIGVISYHQDQNVGATTMPQQEGTVSVSSRGTGALGRLILEAA